MASVFAEQSGRWVKLTEKSAVALKQSPALMKGSSAGVNRAVLTTSSGKITGLLEIVDPKTAGALLTNPALLAGAAGVMAQLAMQQTMDEITEYLAVIDAKIDDVLRAQKDSVLADMIGVELLIEEAMTVRDEVGRVSDVTWSKVQGSSQTIATTQSYALKQIVRVAENLEREDRVGELVKATKKAEVSVREWLAVLARCFQLQDALAVLELDRVLDAAPEELDQHRLGLRKARQMRRDSFAAATAMLLERLDAAANVANAKVLMNPFESPAVVRTCNSVGLSVEDFRDLLGLDGDRQTRNGRRWRDAAADVRDKVVDGGAEGVVAARRFGLDALGRARGATGRVTSGLSDVAARRRVTRREGSASGQSQGSSSGASDA
ncbi:hypothetical protein [Aquipuribacter nitratireducens]|uniref:Uncharacterized protein n=1 Tax=Aquipuribacter nitratireducens TaxID=650104 RepID=A0ABW0GQ30_9MICO